MNSFLFNLALLGGLCVLAPVALSAYLALSSKVSYKTISAGLIMYLLTYIIYVFGMIFDKLGFDYTGDERTAGAVAFFLFYEMLAVGIEEFSRLGGFITLRKDEGRLQDDIGYAVGFEGGKAIFVQGLPAFGLYFQYRRIANMDEIERAKDPAIYRIWEIYSQVPSWLPLATVIVISTIVACGVLCTLLMGHYFRTKERKYVYSAFLLHLVFVFITFPVRMFVESNYRYLLYLILLVFFSAGIWYMLKKISAKEIDNGGSDSRDTEDSVAKIIEEGCEVKHEDSSEQKSRGKYEGNKKARKRRAEKKR